MTIGKVVGTVVCTQKDPGLIGKKMLVVQPLDIEKIVDKGNVVVSIDGIGAGIGDIVMVVTGGSARLAEGFSKVPVDNTIIAIVDTIEVKGNIVLNNKKGV